MGSPTYHEASSSSGSLAFASSNATAGAAALTTANCASAAPPAPGLSSPQGLPSGDDAWFGGGDGFGSLEGLTCGYFGAAPALNSGGLIRGSGGRAAAALAPRGGAGGAALLDAAGVETLYSGARPRVVCPSWGRGPTCCGSWQWSAIRCYRSRRPVNS
jgi:hypothetical protein